MKVYQSFNPLQPEWAMNLDSFQILRPSIRYENSIAYVYKIKTATSSQANTALPGIPDGCIDLVFNLDGIQSECLLVPSPKKRILVNLNAQSTYFGIRLLPIQNLFSFELSLKEINSKDYWSLFDVSPQLRILYELLLQKDTFEDQLAQLESYLTTLSLRPAPSSIVTSCINQIITHHGNLHVKDLEKFSGYSERYLRMLFQNEIGLAPKTFIQFVNFQYIIQDMIKGDFQIENHLNEKQYYDTSHFYKTFKKYTNMTPIEYKKILVR